MRRQILICTLLCIFTLSNSVFADIEDLLLKLLNKQLNSEMLLGKKRRKHSHCSRVPRDYKGPTGPTGATGPTGETGPTGATGAISANYFFASQDNINNISNSSPSALFNLGTMYQNSGDYGYKGDNTITFPGPGVYFITVNIVSPFQSSGVNEPKAEPLIDGNSSLSFLSVPLTIIVGSSVFNVPNIISGVVVIPSGTHTFSLAYTDTGTGTYFYSYTSVNIFQIAP